MGHERRHDQTLFGGLQPEDGRTAEKPPPGLFRLAATLTAHDLSLLWAWRGQTRSHQILIRTSRSSNPSGSTVLGVKNSAHIRARVECGGNAQATHHGTNGRQTMKARVQDLDAAGRAMNARRPRMGYRPTPGWWRDHPLRVSWSRYA